MPTMTIRYDDELEPILDELKQHYQESTKNKVIVSVLEKHMFFVRESLSLREQLIQLKNQHRNLKDLLQAKDRAEVNLQMFLKQDSSF
jgi:hypothetical protein